MIKKLPPILISFFVNVGPSTENMFPKLPKLSPSVPNEEVLDIINSLENKSTGPSSIPIRMLSIIPDLIILPLAHIIKMSIVTGVYPDLLKNSQGYIYS